MIKDPFGETIRRALRPDKLTLREGATEAVSVDRFPLMITYEGTGKSKAMWGLRGGGSHVTLYIAKPVGKKQVEWEYVTKFIGANPIALSVEGDGIEVGKLTYLTDSDSVVVQCSEGVLKLMYKSF